MSWSLHAVVQPVKPNKRTLRKRWYEAWLNVSHACRCGVTCVSMEAFTHSMTQLFTCLFVPHSAAFRSCEHQPFFYFLTLLSWRFLCSFTSQTRFDVTLTCVNRLTSPEPFWSCLRCMKLVVIFTQMRSDGTCVVILKGKLTVLLPPQSRSPPIRGTTATSARPAKARQWPRLIQITAKVEADNEISTIAHDYMKFYQF